MNKIQKTWDSWRHYRDIVKLPFFKALYRTVYYETKHKEPPNKRKV